MRSRDEGQASAEYAVVCIVMLGLVLGLLSLAQDLRHSRGWAESVDAGASHTGRSLSDAFLY